MVGDGVLEKGSHLLPYLVPHGVLLEGGGGPYQPLAFLPLPLKQASTHLLIFSVHPPPLHPPPLGPGPSPVGSPLIPLPLAFLESRSVQPWRVLWRPLALNPTLGNGWVLKVLGSLSWGSGGLRLL